MRILHVISGLDPQNGGPTAALTGLARAQTAAGLQVTVMATWKIPDGLPVAETLRNDNVIVEAIGPVTGRLSRHPDLAAAVDRQVALADIVHIHAMWEEIQHQAARAARRRGVPYLITPHGMLTRWSLSQSTLAKKLFLAWRVKKNLANAAAMHFISAVERDASLNLAPRAIVEPIGVNLHEFAALPPTGSFRKKYPQIGHRPLIVFLGRIHAGKGLEYLVPALSKCQVKDAMVAAIGPDSGNFRSTIEGLIVRDGLQDRIIFTGMLTGSDKVAALADADLFCLPSDHENFGLAIIEALAAGTPVIISRHVAIWQEIVNAGVGVAVEQDSGILGAELSRWLTDDTLRKTAAAKTRAFVWEHYDWLAIGRRWVAHYQQLKL